MKMQGMTIWQFFGALWFCGGFNTVAGALWPLKHPLEAGGTIAVIGLVMLFWKHTQKREPK